MKKRSVVMYNMIFPVFIIFSPMIMIMLPFAEPLWAFVWLLLIVGGNLVLDWVVTALALRWQKIPNVRQKSLSALLRVWLAGFAADFLSSLMLLAVMLIDNDWIYQNIHSYFYNNVFEGPFALAYTLAAILFGGALIYRFNINWALEPVDITDEQRRRTALTLAVLTAPWLFLLPTRLFYV